MSRERGAAGRSGWKTGSGSGSRAGVMVRLCPGRKVAVAEELTDEIEAFSGCDWDAFRCDWDALSGGCDADALSPAAHA